MRCKSHPSDLSSSAGVCASCLRERLTALIAAQARLVAAAEDRVNPPPHFPRSVSPYVSDHAKWPHLDRRFYSTPQAGPTQIAADGCKKKRFSLLSTLFRSRSDKGGSDPRPPSSPSWLSTLLSGRRKKQLTLRSTDDSKSNALRRLDRGMSPAGTVDHDEEDCDRGSSETSPRRWRRTPVTGTPSTARRGRHGHSRSVSGLAFCLSPLVRASPSWQWKQNGGGLGTEVAHPGEVRVSEKPHLSAAAAFCGNRSRKLADFGRTNHNR